MPKRTKKLEKEPRDITTDKTDALTRDIVAAAESLKRDVPQPTPEEFAKLLDDHRTGMSGHPLLEHDESPIVLAQPSKPIRIGSANVVLPTCPICGTVRAAAVCPVDGHRFEEKT